MIVGAIALILVLILIAGYSYLRNKNIIQSGKSTDYVIPNVPYVGIFNHKDAYSHVSDITPGGVVSVLEYWNPGKNNLSEVGQSFDHPENQFFGLFQAKDFFEKRGGYTAEEKHLEISDLKKYINPDVRTPLLLLLSIDKEQPLNVQYYPFALLIGIKESQQKMVFHSTWFGNNFELTLDEFNELEERMRPDMRNNYLIVQPEDFQNKLDEVKNRTEAPYASRTEIMNKAQNMFKNFALGRGAFRVGLDDLAMDYYTKVKNDPNFNGYFPPYYKARTFQEIARVYFQKKDFDNALAHINQTIDLNHDLDKPFKDWPGYEFRMNKADVVDRYSFPYKFLGDIYVEKKEYSKAVDSYKKTLDISPSFEAARKALEIAELQLAKTN